MRTKRSVRHITLALLMAPLLASAAKAQNVSELSLDELLNTTITTASKFKQRLSEAPSNTTVIRGEEIRSHGWRNLSEALVSVNGFEVSNATDYRRLGIRGFNQPGDYNSRILLLLDGIPTNESAGDQAYIGPEFPLDMNLIERIEVVPGPGSALYGGNAYLAVVNVITRPSDSIGRSATLTAGSAGLIGGQVSAGGKDAAGRHWLISLSNESSTGASRYFPQWDGVAGYDGWQRGMDGERMRRLFLRYGGDDWSLHLMAGRHRRDSAGAMFGTDFDVPSTDFDETTQIGLRFTRPLDTTWTLEGNAFVGQADWNGLYSYSGVWESDNQHSQWIGSSAQLTGSPWAGQTWVLGASFRSDVKRDQWNVGAVDHSERHTVSFFAQDDIRFNEVYTLNLGGRYDHDTLGINQFSPRGALLVKLPAQAVLKLLAGQAFRQPNAYETNYSDPGFQLPGGKLKPERIESTEVVLEQAIGAHGRWTASWYRNQFKDLLGVVLDPVTSLYQFQTVGDARTDGLELGTRFRFEDGLQLRASLSGQHCENGAGAPLPSCPSQLAKILAIVPLGTYELGWETYYTGLRRDVFGGEVGGQAVSHATLSGRFSRKLRWQMRANNVFDQHLDVVVGTDYSTGAAGNVPTIADHGRQLRLSVTADF